MPMRVLSVLARNKGCSWEILTGRIVKMKLKKLTKSALPAWADWDGTSVDEPRTAKEFKDENVLALSGLAAAENGIRDADGNCCIFFKFLNGRTAVAELLDSLEDADRDLVYDHRCTAQELRRFWSTTGAAIAFGFGFIVTVEDDNQEAVDVIIRRAPGDNPHPADEFTKDLLKGAIANAAAKKRASNLVKFGRGLKSVQESGVRVEDEIKTVKVHVERLENSLGEALGLLSSLVAGRP